jgi:hypothetical protein
MNSMVSPAESTARVEVCPNACDLDVRFVDTLGPIRAADLTAKALIQHRRITLDPAPDRDIVDRQAPLSRDLLQITVRQGVSQVPPNALEDDSVFKNVTRGTVLAVFASPLHPTKSAQVAFATEPF